MKTMEANEVNAHWMDVLREVEETGHAISVSNGGRVVAQIGPAPVNGQTKHDPRETIAEMEAFAAEISADLPDTVEIINDIRRF